jgi:hypothetical protein
VGTGMKALPWILLVLLIGGALLFYWLMNLTMM